MAERYFIRVWPAHGDGVEHHHMVYDPDVPRTVARYLKDGEPHEILRYSTAKDTERWLKKALSGLATDFPHYVELMEHPYPNWPEVP
ncbi:MAG TPA: hypothetical protein VGD46_19450 [Rhizobacter sp.]